MMNLVIAHHDSCRRCGGQGWEVWKVGVWGVGVRYRDEVGVRCEGGVLCVMWECQVCLLCLLWGRGVWVVMCRRVRCRGMRYRGKVQGWGVGVWDVKMGFYVWCESGRCVCCGDVVCEVQGYEVWRWGMEVRHRGEVWGCEMWRWGSMWGVRVSGVFAAGTWCVRCRGMRCGGEVWR